MYRIINFAVSTSSSSSRHMQTQSTMASSGMKRGDPSSASNFQDVRVTHMNIHWNIQFARRVVTGHVDYDVEVCGTPARRWLVALTMRSWHRSCKMASRSLCWIHPCLLLSASNVSLAPGTWRTWRLTWCADVVGCGHRQTQWCTPLAASAVEVGGAHPRHRATAAHKLDVGFGARLGRVWWACCWHQDDAAGDILHAAASHERPQR